MLMSSLCDASLVWINWLSLIAQLLLVISVDPVNDDSEHLVQYGTQYHYLDQSNKLLYS